jgi:hypothetical protein
MLREAAMFWLILPALGAPNAALIAFLSGTVTIGQSTRASSFDWVAEGAVLSVGEKSKAVLILMNGRRFEMAANARATVGPAELSRTSGPVHEIDPLPPMPRPAALQVGTDTAGAARFRGATKIPELCPREGMAVRSDAAKLSFQRVAGARTYQVVLEDEEGNAILNQQTSSIEILLPSLHAASRYYWRVRAMGEAGVIAEDRAAFVTLSEEQMRMRQAFAKAAADNPGLLAEVDFESGLVREALDEFRAALGKDPGDAASERGLARVQAALAGK